ncbi:hypothetical protein TD95_002897 [Thielaviopsis punctulata]|uniref:CMP/dCMP-type deaminase domain-containing protein n=1 Tax=Thielaviopsis punctulata TaxID=72032 RepID=A0A0F4ZEG8_9PEZI|nr:hypothetical protein TD95_002897 [Thielaviopsis punctulata]
MVVPSSSLPADAAAAADYENASGHSQTQQLQNSEHLPSQILRKGKNKNHYNYQSKSKNTNTNQNNPLYHLLSLHPGATSSASRLSTSSNSSSLSPLIKARGIFASAARLVQKAPRKVISALKPGKSDGSPSRSKSSSHRSSLPNSEMSVDSVDVLAPQPAVGSDLLAATAHLSTDSQPLKENASPGVASCEPSIGSGSCADDGQSSRLSFSGSTYSLAPLRPLVPLGEAGRPERSPEEDAVHEAFTQAALEMARLALRTNETPVGCVLVHDGKVIAKGMNATNVTRNGTRHAEFMAVCSLLGQPSEPGADVSFPKFDPELFNECTLYVTVEPCVMCASFLRQLGIKKVFFGAVNDKFGGTGGVFNIHKNCQKLDEAQLAQGTDGGPVGRGFDVEGGWGRDEAVALLRRFYVQENGRGNEAKTNARVAVAPVPRKKEGRAARLAALEHVNGITVGEVDAGMLSTLDSNSSNAS